MGNKFSCKTKNNIGSKSSRRFGGGNKKKIQTDEEILHMQALSLAIQHHQQSQRFENGGSMSRRIGSTSSRRRNNPVSDQPLTNNPKQQKQSLEFLENLETKKVVLIHGEGFGAWCWYKTIALLEESGMVPTALDLTGSGIDLKDTNHITTLEDYSKPLTDYLQNLPEDEKVILVGHSIGGACVSYALEHFQQKISKAVFLCGTMVADGQKAFDVFAEQLGSSELFMKESKFLIHGNGKDNPATGFMFEKQQMRGLYFNQSPAKDIALAMVSVRPIPLGPIMQNLSLSKEKYGTCRRFYIQTLEDHALSPDIQEKLVRDNPPEGVFKIKGSDHCPFFSKPQSLHKILLEIAQIA
uniref:putative methylesterase 12, chloroplastic isoform X2 n=1 Tax=Erigeron canadensis TaxID=72917 RepID=UPI001CB920B2|nr:putative methylesterase 12, chloroplastic isoform X2 [Erigeron canadensis]